MALTPPHTVTIQGCGYPNKSGSSRYSHDFSDSFDATNVTPISAGAQLSSKLGVMAEFSYMDLLPLGHDETTYRKIAEGGVEAAQAFGRSFLSVDP